MSHVHDDLKVAPHWCDVCTQQGRRREATDERLGVQLCEDCAVIWDVMEQARKYDG